MRTVQVLVDAADRRNKRDLASLVVCIRHSQGTDAKVLDHFLKGLEGEDE